MESWSTRHLSAQWWSNFKRHCKISHTVIFNAPAERSVRTRCHVSSAQAPASCRSPTDNSCSCATLGSRTLLGQELHRRKQPLAVVMELVCVILIQLSLLSWRTLNILIRFKVHRVYTGLKDKLHKSTQVHVSRRMTWFAREHENARDVLKAF